MLLLPGGARILLPRRRAPSASQRPPTKRSAGEPLRVILNGLSKDAAHHLRINGFTMWRPNRTMRPAELKGCFGNETFSDGERARVKCYRLRTMYEGVAIMRHEGVDVSITGNSTNPPASSIPLQAPTKSGPLRTARNISPWLPAAAPAAPCIPTTWRRPGLLWHDRYHGPHALRCPVRRFLLRASSRRDDGPDRYGQQSHGGRLCCGCRCGGAGEQIICIVNNAVFANANKTSFKN